MQPWCILTLLGLSLFQKFTAPAFIGEILRNPLILHGKSLRYATFESHPRRYESGGGPSSFISASPNQKVPVQSSLHRDRLPFEPCRRLRGDLLHSESIIHHLDRPTRYRFSAKKSIQIRSLSYEPTLLQQSPSYRLVGMDGQ